ncbi:hybrid sensor histidine kinase/response regulator [Pedobacter puniceum]|jgi:PAS domain S-box-containing protein|uniref:histidine kinase n=1 Tax=Pedobacter puniceum TaxID=2666136 RepID=A0A7K0FPF0_9SPHI|nr:hybrid sensor histidine kinase/response regulator [Pedobacter puniceum]MRX47753.1 response regulator [Pedobacter puniceum]
MKPVKVLLIDDDEDDYILTKEIFNDIPQKEKYQLSWINNYEEGINAMLKSHYDIYLVDYRLGKYTGIDLLKEAIKSNVGEPIIILTGKGDSKVDDEALQIGAADYLIKDKIDPYTIERSIRYALKHTLALKALKESENKFKIIFERSKEPFVIIDSFGAIRDINEAGLRFFKYTREELELIKGVDLYLNRKDNTQFVQQMDEKGSVNDFETQLITKEKEIRTVAISAFLQIDQHATQELYYCIIHDITNRKKEEKAIVDIEKLAVTERIVKGLSNEIRNPLSNINLSLEQLKLDLNTNDETINLYLNILKTNFDKINLLVSNLVSSTQNRELNIQTKVINHILEESIIKTEDELTHQSLKIDKDFNTTDIMVDVDEEQILQALQNVFINAIEAGANYISVKTAVKNNEVEILISDNGSGVQPEDQKRIFEPFFTHKAKSLGMGLANAQKILLNHKGKISLEDTSANGSTFAISIPVSKQINLWDAL